MAAKMLPMVRQLCALSRNALFLVVIISCAAASASLRADESDPPDNSERQTDPQIWVNAALYRSWDHPPAKVPAYWDKRTDGWEMFTVEGQHEWKHVLDRVSVIATTGAPIQNACIENRTKSSPRNCLDLGSDQEKSLDQFFRFLKVHHIPFALEAGLLVDTQLTKATALNRECGREAFGREADLRATLQRIQDAGGNVDYIRMDEPFWYGTMSCKDTIDNIAADLARTIQNIVKSYFPNARIGDVEPVVNTPGDPDLVARWADAFEAATGQRLAFFQVDPAWSNDSLLENLVATGKLIGRRSIPYGIMFTSDDDSSDLAWTERAISHFTTIEYLFHAKIDQAVFPSWSAHPTYVLPEQKAGTLMNVAYQYLLPKTFLSIEREENSRNQVTLKLIDAKGRPIRGAKIRVEAVDTKKGWGLTNRVMQSVAPAGALYGVVGIRANLEGSRMALDSGEVDIGAVNVVADGKTWTTNNQTPIKLKLSSTTTVRENLSIREGLKCNGMSAIPIVSGATYTLSVPLAATRSADHAGYVTIVFLDKSCNGIKRSNLYFSPSSVRLTDTHALADAGGTIKLAVPMKLQTPGIELRAYYDGDGSVFGPSVAVLTLIQ